MAPDPLVVTTAARALLTQAQGLWAGRFQGVLSTHSAAHPGYPFGSSVPYCLDRLGHPLLLLSHLAQHTRNLLTDPRCAFTLLEATTGDIQQVLRLTCVAQCHPLPPDANAQVERYLRYYPASRPYWAQLNFRLFRLEPIRFHLNGGFAAARWAVSGDVLRSNPIAPDEEAALIEHLTLQSETLHRLAMGQHPGRSLDAPLEIAGIDGTGVDLRCAGGPLRIVFPDGVTDGEGVLRLMAQP